MKNFKDGVIDLDVMPEVELSLYRGIEIDAPYIGDETHWEDLVKDFGASKCGCDECHLLHYRKEQVVFLMGRYWGLRCALRKQAEVANERYRNVIAKAEAIMHEKYKQDEMRYLESKQLGSALSTINRYAGHDESCRTIQLTGRVTSPDKCSCGFRSALLQQEVYDKAREKLRFKQSEPEEIKDQDIIEDINEIS